MKENSQVTALLWISQLVWLTQTFNIFNYAVSLLSTQDSAHGPVTSQVFDPSIFSSTIKVEFLKAKGLGVHTGVGTHYVARNLAEGKTVRFYWDND